jgi:cation-transporting P-type ATPase A/B
VATAGLGVRGSVDGRAVELTRPVPGEALPGSLAKKLREFERAGSTVVVVRQAGSAQEAPEPVALFSLSDEVKDSAAAAVGRLKRKGLRVMLLTGDNAAAAQHVADQVGIGEVIASLTPEGKTEVLRQLQEQGNRVAFVGDGINDGPALAVADLGLAVVTGTDVALGAAEAVLVRDDLGAVPDAISLAEATLRTIRGNLIWAFGYNIAAIPLAASGFLNPLIASAAMAFSSFFVVANSLRLRRAALG